MNCRVDSPHLLQSMAIKDAAYASPWYKLSPSNRKIIQMIIMRSQRPVVLSIGGFYALSLEQFGSVSNTVCVYWKMTLFHIEIHI